MFKEAGLDPNKPPATFDELMTYAQKLAKQDAAGNPTRAGISLRLVGQGSGVAEKFWYVLYAMGGDPAHPDQVRASGTTTTTTTPAAPRMKFYIDAVHKHKVDDQKLPRDTNAFVSEQAAMHMREANVIGELKEKGPKVQYMTAPIPRGPKRWGSMTQPWSIYVSKGKNVEAAWDFAQFLVSPPMAVQLTSQTAGFPCARTSTGRPSSRRRRSSSLRPCGTRARPIYAEPALPLWDEIESRMADRLVTAYADKSLLDNPAGIAKVMKDMAAQSDELLKKAGLHGTD